MSLKAKDKKFFMFALIFVVFIVMLLCGALIGMLSLNQYLQGNDYVLCNVYDLEKSNKILYGTTQDYDIKNHIFVNFTQGVIIDGNS